MRAGTVADTAWHFGLAQRAPGVSFLVSSVPVVRIEHVGRTPHKRQVSGSNPLTGSQFSGVSALPPLRLVDRISPTGDLICCHAEGR
jgi:hypothetical protein